jgi:hypothetical protein
MTDHLPECADKSVMPHNLDCFCDVIRACEERVIAAAVQRVQALPPIGAFVNELAFVSRAAVIDAIKGGAE